MVLDWYFDFISPFVYLQLQTLDSFPDDVAIRYKPILFAGLLNHWGHKGPAEIPSKRIFTYQYTLWKARSLGVPFKGPRKHPFNPLPFLRLAIAADCDPDAIKRIFGHLWAEGCDPTDENAFSDLGRALGFDDPAAAISTDSVKQTLIANGEEAIAGGVFGVPTFLVDGHLFWGFDATEMVLQYLRNPEGFFDEDMLRAAAVPVGASRIATKGDLS